MAVGSAPASGGRAIAEPTPEPGRPRLGRGYWTLFSASGISNLGDGIDGAALPLLAASLTRDPTLFAGVAVAGRVPWLLFALHAGALADRLDRRRVMGTVNVIRFSLLGVLGLAVLQGWASIWLLYVVTFLVGVAEVVFDTSSQAILPAIVRDRARLERANGLLFGAETVANQFMGPPLGGLLFAVAASLPILLDAGTFLISAGLLFGLSGTFVTPRRGDVDQRSSVTQDIREGLQWLMRHRLLRTLAILLGLMNGLSAMFFAVYALFALETLGLGEAQYGFLLTAGAAGSLAGSLAAGPVVDRVGRGPALWMVLVATVAAPIVVGILPVVWVVVVAMVGFGFSAVVWNVITVSLRQTIIPDHLLGRVNSVYRFLGWGSMPLGALAGGLIADAFGLRAPFLVAGSVMALALVPASRVITTHTIEDARRSAS